MEELVLRYWQQILAIVVFIVWLIRLETAVKSIPQALRSQIDANASEIRRLQHQRNEDQQAHKEARQATNDRLEQMWDDIRETRADIKELLRMERQK